MHFLTRWFICNSVAANLLMVFIIVAGVFTLSTMRIEGFPRIPLESVIVETTYNGASVQQVDEFITQKIEKSLEGIDGVRSITSQTINDYSTVVVRRVGGYDLQKILDKVRLRIDGISNFPDNVQRPRIETSGYDFPALYVNLHGNSDPKTLQKLSRRLKKELLNQPELSKLKIWGLHEAEMRIEVNPDILRRLNLTISDITAKIQNSSLNFQAGSLRTEGGYIHLRADDKAKFAMQYARIPVFERKNGSVIYIDDIAKVEDSFKEGDYAFRFNGEPTSGMEILVGNKENLLVISDVVRNVVSEFEKQLPTNIKVIVWGDSSGYIAERLGLLQDNAIMGLLLVILLLAVFLDLRLAFWVAMGIPISILGAIIVAGTKWVDYSLNDVTTFGFIIALGILVDDAVVVGESVFEERQKIKDPITGTEAGVEKVAVATIFGVLTTIAAFSPMMMLDSPLGKVLAGFSGIVIFALFFSLIESKFILPSHLAALNLAPKKTPSRWNIWAKVQAAAQFLLLAFRDKIYAPVLTVAIRQRYSVVILFLSAAVLGIGLIGLGKIKTVFSRKFQARS